MNAVAIGSVRIRRAIRRRISNMGISPAMAPIMRLPHPLDRFPADLSQSLHLLIGLVLSDVLPIDQGWRFSARSGQKSYPRDQIHADMHTT